MVTGMVIPVEAGLISSNVGKKGKVSSWLIKTVSVGARSVRLVSGELVPGEPVPEVPASVEVFPEGSVEVPALILPPPVGLTAGVCGVTTAGVTAGASANASPVRVSGVKSMFPHSVLRHSTRLMLVLTTRSRTFHKFFILLTRFLWIHGNPLSASAALKSKGDANTLDAPNPLSGVKRTKQHISTAVL